MSDARDGSGVERSKELSRGVQAQVESKVKEGREDLLFGFVENQASGAHWFLGKAGVGLNGPSQRQTKSCVNGGIQP